VQLSIQQTDRSDKTTLQKQIGGIFTLFLLVWSLSWSSPALAAGGPLSAAPSRQQGIVAPILIGDTIWQDLNGNGLQDDGAGTGISGVLVTLYYDDSDGIYEPGTDDTFVGQAITDADGHYQLQSELAGYYWVVIDANTVGDLQATRWIESRVSPAFLWADAGQSYDTVDFGYSAVGTIRGTIYYDRNLDGMQGLGEEGVVGADVCLYSDQNQDSALDAGDPELSCTQTDAQGNYFFRDLFYGSYLVQEMPQVDVGHSTPTVRAVMLDPWSVAAVEVDAFTDILLTSASGHLYVDDNANGSQDPSETYGVANAFIKAINLDTGLSATTRSDVNGTYHFKNLMPGLYSLAVSPTADGYVISGLSVTTRTLEFGIDYAGIDFGYVPDDTQPFPGGTPHHIFTPWITSPAD